LSFEHQISYLAKAAYGLNLKEVNLIWDTHYAFSSCRVKSMLDLVDFFDQLVGQENRHEAQA
jgi:hypothetical protein